MSAARRVPSRMGIITFWLTMASYSAGAVCAVADTASRNRTARRARIIPSYRTGNNTRNYLREESLTGCLEISLLHVHVNRRPGVSHVLVDGHHGNAVPARRQGDSLVNLVVPLFVLLHAINPHFQPFNAGGRIPAGLHQR